MTITLKRSYNVGKIETNILRKIMKEFLLLCTTYTHFTFSRDVFIPLDGVVMGPLLGPLLANVFMCS